MIHGGEVSDKTINIEMDFSVNLSPLGTPREVLSEIEESLLSLNRYPEYSNDTLRNRIAGLWGVGDKQIVCTNGASEAFMAIAHALNPDKSLLLSPSFYGYEYCLHAVKSKIVYCSLSSEDSFSLPGAVTDFIDENTDIFFLGYPNNPTGKAIDPELLTGILNKCKITNTYLVLDISFYEMSEVQPLNISGLLSEYSGLIVVNSFTKLFAIPGVRAGYIMCRESLANRIREQLPEWNMSVTAIAAAGKCTEILQNTDYAKRVRGLIRTEREYLTEGLKALEIKVFESDTAFILISSDEPLYEKLLKENILIRKCDSFPGLTGDYYRIAVKSHEENVKFLDRIRKVLKEL